MTRKCGAERPQNSSWPGLSRPSTFSAPKSCMPGSSPGMTRRESRLTGRRDAELGFQRGDTHLQRLVLLAGQPRHLLYRLEFLALDHIEVAQDAFGLVAHD